MFRSALRYGLVPRGFQYSAPKDSLGFQFFRVIRHTHIYQPVMSVVGCYLVMWEFFPRFKVFWRKLFKKKKIRILSEFFYIFEYFFFQNSSPYLLVLPPKKCRQKIHGHPNDQRNQENRA